MFIDKGGVSRRYIDVYDLDKDNEIGIEVGDEDNSGLVYLTIEEVKQVIEHLQKQISNKIDTGAGFQVNVVGDGLSGFRG
jgi:hypothetical protein